MTQAIKARILAQVRTRIACGESTYICDALDDIAAQDHRRNIQRLCGEIKAEVHHLLAPFRTFGDLAISIPGVTTLGDVQRLRLAWLDGQIRSAAQTNTAGGIR